jgi:hypothetical protein
MSKVYTRTISALAVLLLFVAGPASGQDVALDASITPAAEEKLSTEPLVFTPRSQSYPQLPWGDEFVSQEGLVLLDFVAARQGCTVRVRRPYDAISMRRDDHPDPSRFAGYDLHEQMIGLPKRRFRVDVMTLIRSGCGGLDKLF